MNLEFHAKLGVDRHEDKKLIHPLSSLTPIHLLLHPLYHLHPTTYTLAPTP